MSAPIAAALGGAVGAALASLLPEMWQSGVRWRKRRRMRKGPQRVLVARDGDREARR